jgi:hypothetical protein
MIVLAAAMGMAVVMAVIVGMLRGRETRKDVLEQLVCLIKEFDRTFYGIRRRGLSKRSQLFRGIEV